MGKGGGWVARGGGRGGGVEGALGEVVLVVHAPWKAVQPPERKGRMAVFLSSAGGHAHELCRGTRPPKFSGILGA